LKFEDKMKLLSETVNVALDRYIVEKETPEKIIYQAIKYSIMAGGKRLRPVLALAVCEMLEGNVADVLPYACAIEMIHTYSLIHDDLPAMDNDDYRRGRLTSHKIYGEAIAILAGDALLNYSFEIMLSDIASGNNNQVDILRKVNAMKLIANSAGTNGMIGGQVVDLQSEEKQISSETLEYIHRCKTGALIKAPIMAAATICKADEKVLKALEKYAENIGLAFQVKDDILDVEGNSQKMGKKAGSDADNNKATFVTLYGLEKSKEMLKNITEEAVRSIEFFGEKSEFLIELCEYLLKRDH